MDIQGRRGLYFVLLIGWLFAASLQASEQRIAVFSYYDFAPFVIDRAARRGLSYELIDALNRAAAGRFRFELELYPRKRLDLLLASGEQAVVPFVHWSFMEDPDRTRYLWGPVLMHDRNELVSRVEAPVAFDGSVASLYGLRFGGIIGRRYPELETAMAQGLILRDDGHGEAQNLQRLLAGRIDLTTLPRSVLDYLVQDRALQERLYISPMPRSHYSRHLMTTTGLPEVHRFLAQWLVTAQVDGQWWALLQRYGFSQSPEPGPWGP